MFRLDKYDSEYSDANTWYIRRLFPSLTFCCRKQNLNDLKSSLLFYDINWVSSLTLRYVIDSSTPLKPTCQMILRDLLHSDNLVMGTSNICVVFSFYFSNLIAVKHRN